MLFNLGFTADAAAAHVEEKRTKLVMPLPSLPFAAASSNNTSKTNVTTNTTPTPTPPLSSRPSRQTIASQSGDDDDDGDDDDNDSKARDKALLSPNRMRSPSSASARPKTLFQFAHPVASQRHRRLRLRPKLLLQLHESNALSRPFPKYDVLPAAAAPRLACKFPKLFASLRGLGPRDLVVVTSDMYEQQHDDDRSDWSEDSSHDQREVVATICQPLVKDDPQLRRSATVEILSGPGISWTGTLLSNGSYELVCNAGSLQQQRKARWVARDKRTRRMSSSSSSGNVLEDRKRFTFSVIDPNSRRHPVIASLIRNGIDVFDQYPSPAALSSSSPRELIDLDEELRVLIVTSGIWIAFMEGWARNPHDPTYISDSSQLSLRSKSSTFPGADRSRSGEPVPPTAEASRRMKNRASTQSEAGPVRQGTLRSATSRYRQSLHAESHDQKWTNLSAQEAGNEHDPGESSERAPEDNASAPSKGKSWRRLSAMFGKKRS